MQAHAFENHMKNLVRHKYMEAEVHLELEQIENKEGDVVGESWAFGDKMEPVKMTFTVLPDIEVLLIGNSSFNEMLEPGDVVELLGMNVSGNPTGFDVIKAKDKKTRYGAVSQYSFSRVNEIKPRFLP